MNTVEQSQDTAKQRGHRKELSGTVVSDRQQKSIIVEVVRRKAHPLYKKVVNVRKRYAVHDEENKAKNGDVVKIVETRPISKRKCWRLLEVVSHIE
jgi:small subunit ribosomal protein S17